MKRIPRLEGERSLPFPLADEASCHLGRKHVRAVFRVTPLRQGPETPSEELASLIGLNHPATRVIEPLGPIDRADILFLVPLENRDRIEDRDDLPGFVLERHRGPGRELSRFVVTDRKRKRNRPSVGSSLAGNHLIVENRMPRILGHRPLHGRKRAVRDPVDRREVGIRDAYRLKPLGLL